METNPILNQLNMFSSFRRFFSSNWIQILFLFFLCFYSGPR
ncbi:hypothetical protein LEP1GSC115_1814 [Leptospira interrogans serovar Australis str. 200703203]|uniref:Uncharacterized protein n=1 Tax=Leptospira interrogans serovar Australis str. 200703203 TaxID=1085541 RepID=N1ULM2_LEPIR|nr:hypothetical protein LEP1GSC115_1814 [Leptospira interrogans serovar Australis str. 200703203]